MKLCVYSPYNCQRHCLCYTNCQENYLQYIDYHILEPNQHLQHEYWVILASLKQINLLL